MPPGSVVVADHQSAGRGRLGRTWEAPAGSALLASFVVEYQPLVSLAAGLAVAEACAGAAPGVATRLKWPNDVLVDGAKLAGILVEVTAANAVVGVGVNLTSAPPGAAQLGDVDRDRLLADIGDRLARWVGRPPAEIVAGWRARSDTLGRRVRVDLQGESFEGVAEDVLADGALVVAGRRVSAGDVIHLRPA